MLVTSSDRAPLEHSLDVYECARLVSFTRDDHAYSALRHPNREEKTTVLQSKICKTDQRNCLEVRMHSFGMIWIRINYQRSLGSWSIKGNNESTLGMDSLIPFMNHDLSDQG